MDAIKQKIHALEEAIAAEKIDETSPYAKQALRRVQEEELERLRQQLKNNNTATTGGTITVGGVAGDAFLNGVDGDEEDYSDEYSYSSDTEYSDEEQGHNEEIMPQIQSRNEPNLYIHGANGIDYGINTGPMGEKRYVDFVNRHQQYEEDESSDDSDVLLAGEFRYKEGRYGTRPVDKPKPAMPAMELGAAMDEEEPLAEPEQVEHTKVKQKKGPKKAFREEDYNATEAARTISARKGGGTITPFPTPDTSVLEGAMAIPDSHSSRGYGANAKLKSRNYAEDTAGSSMVNRKSNFNPHFADPSVFATDMANNPEKYATRDAISLSFEKAYGDKFYRTVANECIAALRKERKVGFFKALGYKKILRKFLKKADSLNPTNTYGKPEDDKVVQYLDYAGIHTAAPNSFHGALAVGLHNKLTNIARLAEDPSGRSERVASSLAAAALGRRPAENSYKIAETAAKEVVLGTVAKSVQLLDKDRLRITPAERVQLIDNHSGRIRSKLKKLILGKPNVSDGDIDSFVGEEVRNIVVESKEKNLMAELDAENGRIYSKKSKHSPSQWKIVKFFKKLASRKIKNRAGNTDMDVEFEKSPNPEPVKISDPLLSSQEIKEIHKQVDRRMAMESMPVMDKSVGIDADGAVIGEDDLEQRISRILGSKKKTEA